MQQSKLIDLTQFVSPKKVTEEEIISRLTEREELIKELVKGTYEGGYRSIIISGPAGLGKSYTVYSVLNSIDPSALNYRVIKGYIRATGLFKLLYECKENGQVLVLDDADKILSDETSLNILKAACDSSETREISWQSEAVLISEDGERIPKTFEYKGSMILITNYDIDGIIENKKSKLGPHIQAIISRALYIDYGMKSLRDYFIKVKMIAHSGELFKVEGLTEEEVEDVLSYMKENMKNLREITLRMAKKLGQMRKTNPKNWKNIANVTCCQGRK